MITLKSHGFKFSRPHANIIFDVSYFVNPWREKIIRDETDATERRKKVLDFMYEQEGVKQFVQNITQTLVGYNNLFPDENIQVAFCCSAGEYRSPAFVCMIAHELKMLGIEVSVNQSLNSKL
jgi:RNase adaptor protein for sRNA GlmZ degradation